MTALGENLTLASKAKSAEIALRALLRGANARALLAGQAFFVVGLLRCHRAAVDVGFVVFAGEAGALHGLGAAIVQALYATLPRHPVQHVQVPLIDIARDEDVERLALADERRAIGGEFDDPALIDFERGLEDALLVVGQAIEVLYRAFVVQDR